MNAARWPQLPELVGLVSASVLLLSLTAWSLGHSRLGNRWFGISERVRVAIVRRLPWVWGALSVTMMMLAAGAKAYSGPTDGSRWEAHLRAGNDVGFAFIVALLFGMAFALDALRLPGLEDRLSAGLALLMYTATVAVTVGSVWQRAGP